MRDENRKADADSKIMPFHIKEEDTKDPEMDRFVRESLIREADELEKELNSKPELDGIEAPEGLFESIVGELKERGVWEEEDAAYAELSEEDQKALALGRELVRKQETKKRTRYRRRKILKISVIVAACLGVIFGVSMTSAANRRLVKRMWDGLISEFGFKMNTNYVGDEETVRSKSKEETIAMEEIHEKTGAPQIDFCYLPEGMEYQRYETTDGFESVIFYSYRDTAFSITMVEVNKEGSYYYTYDNDAISCGSITNETGIEAKIWEVNFNLDEKAYIAEIEYKGWRYMLNGMVSLEEMQNIIKYSVFL